MLTLTSLGWATGNRRGSKASGFWDVANRSPRSFSRTALPVSVPARYSGLHAVCCAFTISEFGNFLPCRFRPRCQDQPGLSCPSFQHLLSTVSNLGTVVESNRPYSLSQTRRNYYFERDTRSRNRAETSKPSREPDRDGSGSGSGSGSGRVLDRKPVRIGIGFWIGFGSGSSRDLQQVVQG